MILKDYIKSRGLTVRLVSQKMGVTRQAVEQYNPNSLTARTMERIAIAMTELGAPTTVVDILVAISGNGEATEV